jgi:hypothetical protein
MHSKEKWLGLKSALSSMRELESALKKGKDGACGCAIWYAKARKHTDKKNG